MVMADKDNKLFQVSDQYRKINTRISDIQTILDLMADPSFEGMNDDPVRRARFEKEQAECRVRLEEVTTELNALKYAQTQVIEEVQA
jgi:uncharacterized protein YeeX (DUF496 family)